jgi:hypothetical protein
VDGSTALAAPEVLSPEVWQERAAAHEERVARWIDPHLRRRHTGESHPVEDFLFTYYSQSPAALRRWHPGYGAALCAAEDRLSWKGYGEVAGGVGVTSDFLTSRRPLVESVHRLLSATAGRTPHFGCFGMHEWAMVYRLDPADVRHAAWPLRLGPAGTAEVVEGHRIACSHFDAFRFFTEPARDLNTLQPGRHDRAAFEQPACLHAGMDLYKHAFRLSPLVPSELVADCFALAWDIRVLDMRASPYDFTRLGLEPVRVETTAGKQEYAAAQRDFAARGAPLRDRLVEACARLVPSAGVTPADGRAALRR